MTQNATFHAVLFCGYVTLKLNLFFFLRFPGAILDKAGASVTWNISENVDETVGPFHKLMIKQILLGRGAKDGEYNVVEV